MHSLEDATPAETEAVRQLLHQTMPDATLVRVQRNQHDLLYRQYVARRDAVDAEARQTHERWLWNGNDSIAENISKGFDLRYASQEFNRYGVGGYFAADARLSAYFERSTRDSTGEKKIILARVALGQMAERPAVPGQAQLTRTATGSPRRVNPELTKPEWKLPPPGAQSATSRQRIEAIVYENHQAFPHYLVTYTAGPRRDPYGGGMDLRRIDDAPKTRAITTYSDTLVPVQKYKTYHLVALQQYNAGQRPPPLTFKATIPTEWLESFLLSGCHKKPDGSKWTFEEIDDAELFRMYESRRRKADPKRPSTFLR